MSRAEIFELPDSSAYDKPDTDLVEKYKCYSRYSAWLVLLISLANLAGWLAGINFLKNFFPGAPAQFPLTSLNFLVIASALLFRNKISFHKAMLAGIGIFVFLTSIVSFFSPDPATDFSLWDNFSFEENFFFMEKISAALFILLAFALIIYELRWGEKFFPSQHLFRIILVISSVVITGYFYGIESFARIGFSQGIGLATALNFFLLNFSFLAARPEIGFLRNYLSENFGSIMARRMLPVSIFLTLTLGWLYLVAERNGIFDSATRIGIFVFVMIAIIGYAIWSLARTMNKTDIARKEGEELVLFANRQFYGINDELDKANAHKTEFLHIAAHDLKNPLGRITNYAFLIKDDLDPDSESFDFVSEIEQSSQQMVALIDKLLEKAELEDGRMHLNIDEVDIGRLARRSVEEADHLARQKDQEIIFSSNENCIVNADYEKMHEVVENLLSNAIKFSPRGKKIFLSVERKEDFACLSVKDEGPGLSDDDKEKIFGKFQSLSAQPTGGETSIGLGLYLAKQLVELQNGTIRAQSDGMGKGTRFTVELPLVK